MLCRALHLTSVTYTVITKGGYVTERHDPYASGGRSATLMPNHKVFHVMSPPRRAIPPRFHHTSAESQVLSRSAKYLVQCYALLLGLGYAFRIPGVFTFTQVLPVPDKFYEFFTIFIFYTHHSVSSVTCLYPFYILTLQTVPVPSEILGVFTQALPLPNSSVRSVQHHTRTQQLWEVCKTFIPIPDKSVLFPTTTERIIRTLQNITLHFLQACTSKALNLKWTPASHHNITYPYHFNHRINPIGKRIEKQCLLRLFLMQPTSGRKHKDRGFCSRK